MPEATFYTHVSDPVKFSIRLVQRALNAGSHVLVWAADGEALAQLNHDFWALSPESFLPHQVWEHSEPYPHEVALVLSAGRMPEKLEKSVTVLNLSPAFWCDAPELPARVLEIVSDNLDDLAEARNRFRAYQQQGFTITHHNMSGKA